jgi:hypothetical protein
MGACLVGYNSAPAFTDQPIFFIALGNFSPPAPPTSMTPEESAAALMESLNEQLRLALENPHTAWVLSFLNWTSLLVFILCMTPCALRIRRTGRFASGIGASWAGLLIFFICGG